MVYKGEVERLFVEAKELLYLVCVHMVGVPEGCYVEIPLIEYKEIFDRLSDLCVGVSRLEGEDYPCIRPVDGFVDKGALHEALKRLG